MLKNCVNHRHRKVQLYPATTQYTVGVFSLPANTAYGQLRVTVKGNTRTNPVLSSNMNTDSNADGIVDNFTVVTGGATVTKSLDSAQKIEITAATGYPRIDVTQSIVLVPGDIISARFEYKTSGNVQVRMGFEFYNSSNGYISGNSTTYSQSASYAEKKQENITVPANTAYVKLNCSVTPSVDSGIGSVWFKNAMLEKAATVGNYITSGTKSTFMDAGGEVKSGNKNLFDKNSNTVVAHDISTVTGLDVAGANRARIPNKIKVLPSTTYIVSVNSATCAPRIAYYYDSAGNYIGYVQMDTNAFTTLANCTDIRVNFKRIDNANITAEDIAAINNGTMVELGASATAYVPHEHTKATIPAGITLRSLPNDVKDELTDDGIHTQRIGVKAYNGTEAWVQSNTNTNTYIMRLDNSLTNNLFGASGNAKLYFANGESFNYVYVTDDYEHIYFINGNVYIVILKTKVDSQAGASIELKFKAYLAGNQASLNYQLLSEIESTVTIRIIDQDGNAVGGLRCYGNNTTVTQKPCAVLEDFPIAGVITLPITTPLVALVACYKNTNTDANPMWVDALASSSLNTGTGEVTITGADDTKMYLVVASVNTAYSTLATISESHPINAQVVTPKKTVLGESVNGRLVMV